MRTQINGHFIYLKTNNEKCIINWMEVTTMGQYSDLIPIVQLFYITRFSNLKKNSNWRVSQNHLYWW